MAQPKNKQQQKKQRRNQAAASRRAAQRKRTFVKGGAIIGIMALIALAVVAASLGGGSTTTSATTTTSAAAASTTSTTAKDLGGTAIKGVTPCPAFDGSSARATSFEQAPPTCIDKTKTYTATFDTNQGSIPVVLDTTKTPNTTNNFIVLALYHYYDGTQIFRTDTSIDIIQGGSPHTESASDQGPGYTIKDEGSGFTYGAGDLVMARSSGADSASAQFFFVTGDKASALNSQGNYVTFGKTSATDVLSKIIGLNVADASSGLGGAPSTPVTINSIKITSN